MLVTIARTILLILLCVPLLGSGDVTPHPVEIVPHWKKGDTFDLTITRTREKSVDGKSTISGRTRTRFIIDVLSKNDEGYLVGWTADETVFEIPAPSESFLRQVVGLMQGLKIVLQITPHGTIVGVENWKEIQNKVLKVMDDVLANTPNSQQGAKEKAFLSNLRAQWETQFATKEQIERLCTRDAQMYFLPLGRAYGSEKPYEYEDRLPNPLGGEPFPAHARIALTTFNEQSKQAALTWSHTADPQQATRIVQSMIKDLASKRGKSAPDGIVAQPITIDDTADITVDVRTGWITTVSRKQSIQLGARVQTDRTSIVKVAR